MSRARLRRYFRHGLLPQLMVFEAVARLGGVTRAAEELHLAQPTVSMQLKKLSGALGVVLFEQRGRQLHLTAAGHALRETCEELTALLVRAEERLAPWRQASAETLRLAAEPEARAVAARLIAAFCARHPGVQVSLYLAGRAELLSRFTAGADDVYLFELEVEGLPLERRWSVLHAKRRELAASAALFLREALLDAPGPSLNNSAGPTEIEGETKEESKQWKSRATTTRRRT
jgi:LysR family transcriptional regulator, low CO2-responsive transcriptional regulator